MEHRSFTHNPTHTRFVVDLWITGRCDMACPFCYGADVPQIGPDRNYIYSISPETMALVLSETPRREMTKAQIESVLIKLKEAGVTTVTISGGEPLIRKDTPEIIRFAYMIGLEVYLSTNGTFLSKYYTGIKDHLSALGLSLDGSTSEMNLKMGRSDSHYKTTLGLLEYFKNDRPSHLLKVGTVVSKINQHDIEAIGQVLFNSSHIQPPDVWRLYQFEPLKAGAIHRMEYEITLSEFQTICSRVTSLFPNVVISSRSREDHINAYFFVTPDGMLQVVNEKHRSIADLLSTDVSVLKSIIEQNQKTLVSSEINREWLDQQRDEDEKLGIVDEQDNLIDQKPRTPNGYVEVTT